MSQIYELADALVTAIKAITRPTNCPTFQCSRVYSTWEDLVDLATNGLQVPVLMSTDEADVLARDTFHELVTIEAGLVWKFPAGLDPRGTAANATIDPLMALARAIAFVFDPGQSIGSTSFSLLNVKIPLIYDMPRAQNRIFLAVVKFQLHQETAAP